MNWLHQAPIIQKLALICTLLQMLHKSSKCIGHVKDYKTYQKISAELVTSEKMGFLEAGVLYVSLCLCLSLSLSIYIYMTIAGCFGC
jgi:hypothetical protein